MKQKVIVYKKVDNRVLEYLRPKFNVVYFEEINDANNSEFIKHLQDADALLGAVMKIDAELLAKSPQLKVVSNISVGYDNLDLQALTERGVLATNTPGVLDETVADVVFGLLLSAARRIPELDAYVRQHNWDKIIDEKLFGMDVHGKTIGIVGMGAIGKAIAQRARFGFGMNILYHNRNRNEEVEAIYDAAYRSFNDLLEQSDFVCNMVPANAATKDLYGAAEFKLMKNHAIFVNGSRGALVDEDALYEALVSKEIAGAGLDVFKQEPINGDNPLLTLPNVVLLPHIGSATTETRLKMGIFAADSLIKILAGEIPENVINRTEKVK